jgi:hypothetical protein
MEKRALLFQTIGFSEGHGAKNADFFKLLKKNDFCYFNRSANELVKTDETSNK